MSEHHEKMLNKMWSALLDDPNFVPMIEAWDDYCEEEGLRNQGQFISAHANFERDFERLDAAFKGAIQAYEYERQREQEAPELIVKLSSAFQLTFISEELTKLEMDTNGLCGSLKHEIEQGNTARPLLVWVDVKSSRRQILLALSRYQQSPDQSFTFSVECIDLDWQAQIEPVLERMFSLSQTEISIAREMYLGVDTAEIANRRNRSIHTVRTQIKSTMEKMGVSTQKNLVKLLSSLSHFYRQAEAEAAPRDAVLMQYVTDKAYQHSYYQYGPEDGQPVFVISTTVSPKPTPRAVRLAQQHGLRVIAPVRPGSASSSKRDLQDGPEVIATEYQHLINALGINSITVVGYASGGIYACALAALLQEQCKALITVDTGHPLKTMADILRMPLSAKRTFLVARYAQKMLFAPHKIAANDFHSGKEGEQRLIDFFFDGQAHDAQRVKRHRHLREATRNLISFSFEDVERLVCDVTYWSRDWSEIVNQLSSRTHKLAMIGAENMMFDQHRFESWCRDNEWHCDVVADEGQLLIFSQPDYIAARIAEPSTDFFTE